MSKQSSEEFIVANQETLEMIKEENSISSHRNYENEEYGEFEAEEYEHEQKQEHKLVQESQNRFENKCPCHCALPSRKETVEEEVTVTKVKEEEIKQVVEERETELQTEFNHALVNEVAGLKEKFDIILQNEQIRASYMIREAHRDRNEKLDILKSQLECKNLTALMYVLCLERRKSKLEKLRLIEEYTGYIRALQNILTEGQELILHLSRGYKTAARVDHEWREKMKKVLQEFKSYIYHYMGGGPESTQFLLDLPQLLRTEAPLADDPHEDPCDEEEEVLEEETHDEADFAPSWWQKLEAEERPFIMFGDMAEFKPPQRRQVLRTVKAAKTAPAKWKEYVFNEMFLKADCPNLDKIKDEYPKNLPTPQKWECRMTRPDHDSISANESLRRLTALSIDPRGVMGSILKLMTTSNNMSQHQNTPKTTLLAAKDSMELASSTKILEHHHHNKHEDQEKSVVLDVKHRRTSLFEEQYQESFDEHLTKERKSSGGIKDEEADEFLPDLRSIPNDSLEVVSHRVPDQEGRINFERVCPMEKCQKLKMDSFSRQLPPYMKASPFTHFEHSFDDYETCTPEQLEIIKSRIEEKKRREKEKREKSEMPDPLAEWTEVGVATQTSERSMSLPPCTCRVPSPTPASSIGAMVYDIKDLHVTKQQMNEIAKESMFDDTIDFKRFKLIGEDSTERIRAEKPQKQVTISDFKKTREQQLKKLLLKHPSLLDLFQTINA